MAGLSAGCRAGDENGPTAGNPVELTICMYGIQLDSYVAEDDLIRLAIEQATNTRITFETYPIESYNREIAASVSSDGGADLIQNWGGKEETGTWAGSGWLVDLYGLVKADPGRYPIVASMMDDPIYRLYNEMYTGDTEKAYGFYTLFGSTMYNNYIGDLVYNTKILREAGFDEPPTTIDEFMDYGRAAAAKGYIAWYPRNWNLQNFQNMNYSVLAPLDTAIEYPDGAAWTGMRQNADGSWFCATTSGASKKGIKILRQMVDEGILPKEIGDMPDFGETIGLWANDMIGCISYYCTNPYQYQWALGEYRATHPGAGFEDVTLGPLLKTSGGDIGKQNYLPFYIAANWVVPQTSADKAQAVLDLIEFIGSPEGQDLIFKGIEGVHYTVGGGGNPVFDMDEWNKITRLFGYEDGRCTYPGFEFLYSGALRQGYWGGDSLWVSKSANLMDYTAQISGYTDDFQKARDITDRIQAEVGNELPPYYVFISLSQESMDIRARLKEISLEYLPAFITGTRDIDAGWPEYVKAYEEAGVQALVDDFNAQIEIAKQKYEALTKFSFVLTP
ncbi:MAG: extracellular solute-binding protein [Oscillospiraceae bacterium]|nr:extracellular solute-binding protein [Oscillospiraceae bacterium]